MNLDCTHGVEPCPYCLEEELEKQDEKMFELQEEINRLRTQVTYLQEELYSAEDRRDSDREEFEKTVVSLEQQLGNALFRSR